MDARIENIAARCVAYMRHVGPYNERDPLRRLPSG
jgi:DNA gyrase inhibitor GyrI